MRGSPGVRAQFCSLPSCSRVGLPDAECECRPQAQSRGQGLRDSTCGLGSRCTRNNRFIVIEKWIEYAGYNAGPVSCTVHVAFVYSAYIAECPFSIVSLRHAARAAYQRTPLYYVRKSRRGPRVREARGHLRTAFPPPPPFKLRLGLPSGIQREALGTSMLCKSPTGRLLRTRLRTNEPGGHCFRTASDGRANCSDSSGAS